MNHSIKIITSITVLVALIIAVGITGQKILGATSRELEGHISEVEGSISSSDWKTAEKKAAAVQAKWSGIKGSWAVLIDHQEIDNIDVTLTRMQKFILSHDISSAMAEASALNKFVRHIPVKEALSFENIF